MFEIEIFCDRSISENERAMIERAALMTDDLFGSRSFVYHDVTWDTAGQEGIPASCDEIISAAPEDEKGRKNVSLIMDLMKDVMKVREKTGAMIIFTACDLFLKDNWCFGAARVGGGVSVQSIRRYRDLAEDDMQPVIARTLRHEVGHIHKCAADPERLNTELKYGRHCTVPGCTMRQSPTLTDLLKHAKEEDPKACLCELCRADLEKFKKDNY